MTCGDTDSLVHKCESTFIAIGTQHRLENPGRSPLPLIVVKSGSFPGEDEIERFGNPYGRELLRVGRPGG